MCHFDNIKLLLQKKQKKKKNEMKVEENVYLLNAFNQGNGKHRFM